MKFTATLASLKLIEEYRVCARILSGHVAVPAWIQDEDGASEVEHEVPDSIDHVHPHPFHFEWNTIWHNVYHHH